MSFQPQAREFERASIQLEAASDVLVRLGAMIRAIQRASEMDREALTCIAQTYIDDWAEILHSEAKHFAGLEGGAK